MELLRECPLLKIEDIMPFFQDFVAIDQFKVIETMKLFKNTLFIV